MLSMLLMLLMLGVFIHSSQALQCYQCYGCDLADMNHESSSCSGTIHNECGDPFQHDSATETCDDGEVCRKMTFETHGKREYILLAYFLIVNCAYFIEVWRTFLNFRLNYVNFTTTGTALCIVIFLDMRSCCWMGGGPTHYWEYGPYAAPPLGMAAVNSDHAEDIRGKIITVLRCIVYCNMHSRM